MVYHYLKVEIIDNKHQLDEINIEINIINR